MEISAYLDRRIAELSEPLAKAGAERLIRAYAAGIPLADLAEADPELVYGAALGLLAFMRERKPGTPSIRVFDPDLDRHGWVSSHSVVEIINDDMPFLVDSVAMELARRGIKVHLLVHPVVRVDREESGTLGQIAANGGGSSQESVMHVEIDRQPAEIQAQLADSLAQILGQVRHAVADWRRMLETLWAGVTEFEGASTKVAAEEKQETLAFLEWLADNHFTFLGYRRFDLSKGVVADPASSLGILSDAQAHVFDDTVTLADMPAELRAFVSRPDPLMVTKSARHSVIHRPVRMDIIGLKQFDAKGRVVGLHAFLGLFTSSAYNDRPAQIPLLRRKIAQVEARAGFNKSGHDAKALVNILETYPRDELFQVSEDALFETSIGILHLQDRQRVAVFLRNDEFERFVSCLVFVPRDRYDTPLRLSITIMLEEALGGTLDAFYTQVADLPLARLHFIIRTTPGHLPKVDAPALEARIADVARTWYEHLQDALIQTHGEAAGLALARRWGKGFPVSYREGHSALAAVADVGRIQTASGGDIVLNLYRPVEAEPHQGRLKLYRSGHPVPLSGILPMLEAMGLVVIAEVPYEITPESGDGTVWIHDFEVESADGSALDVAERRELFHDALAAVWRGDSESDGFNRLVLSAGLSWREIMVLRAYTKYLRQTGITYSQAYIEQALGGNAQMAACLVRLFLASFDPDATFSEANTAEAGLLAGLDKVVSADDDRILRRFLNLVRSTLRTNYFQTDAAGKPKAYLSFKLDSKQVDDLPAPRPMVEVFVYSPRVEAIHLRGGKVARGGIRWSDRREDFRTEILGLMKAQMVKNAVIVPVGAKGGFVVKRPPTTGGREAYLAEGIECYKILMRGLLDLTDNLTPEGVKPPRAVLRRDGDDAYLVVAADKGTATFSDIANSVSLDYGHWLGDAFASGGSQGYDHKKMGITAKGAWVAVERHFREMGIDTRTEAFTVIGVGDMSGDVFGNGLLRSPHARLVAAFNHAHIFLDPDPDPAKTFAERERLFNAVKAWPDYDTSTISKGGGIWPRTAKTIPISPQAKARFGIEADTLTPTELIRTLLKAQVDLLFLGGIGTYVKASTESNADAGDRANDSLRINGSEIGAKVVGEGANLGFTQLGRIEYALSGAGGAGGRIDTDAIDNSAGVDCSDHEVNIKILVNDLVAAGDLTPKQRDKLLAEMTEEVGALVLRDNYLQTQAISMLQAQGADLLDAEARFMRLLEKSGRLDRAIEFLPTDETLTERAARKQGFTRPELAVLLAYGKIWLYDHILASELPDDPFMAIDLTNYFPTQLRDRFGSEIQRHRLRREIIATVVTNSIVNRVGGAFVSELMETTGHPPAQVARAYIVARDAFRMREVWRAIEELDGKVSATAQTAMQNEANRLVERATLWVLRSMPSPFALGAGIAELSPGVRALEGAVPGILPPDAAAAVLARIEHFVGQGVPHDLAQRVGNLIVLASAADILRIATRQDMSIEAAGRLYFAVGARFSLGWLRASAEKLSGRGHWLKLAAAAAIEDLYGHQRDITSVVAASYPGLDSDAAVQSWLEANRAAVERAETLLAELKAASHIDLSMIMVANRQLRTLTESGVAAAGGNG
ncbi:NAD-specific glutamate dehydrogenase large form [Paramagnetospirillum magnetotacticum MS-1]|uniref:NAD-specific glutamate dehydrogenase large form n=1 Tax=Paramagnetospirillum magnetotacticum MS-1 TaxID=272627 RepID=A0A0C2YSY3_PARME|nr:NAD-glutamate dehydrogenase [Paramagnetospirillum magnetotacticum]KIL97835.1 NAD-specific glutamate dehydrogenase large form [Paramagnetospirillum magnetotacticum MS-1]